MRKESRHTNALLCKHEIRQDIGTYTRCLALGDATTCLVIEDKYGLVGEMPETVSAELNRWYDEAPE